jgi:hypothetical protein
MAKSIRMDATTTAEVLAQSTENSRVFALRTAMGTGTQTVSVKDASAVEKLTGTFAGTALTTTGNSFLPQTALSSVSGAGGTVGVDWTCSLTNAGGRWIEGEFGAGEVFSASGVLSSSGTTSLKISLASATQTPVPPAPETTVVLSTALAIPADFVGMHSTRHPADNETYDGVTPSSFPSFGFGWIRSHNYIGSHWIEIHTAPGVYNWTKLDEWVNAYHAQGKKILYNLYATPEHLQWPGLGSYPTGYPSWPGANSMPSDMAQVTAFITALVNRYNTGGVKKIHAIEVWNEPDPGGQDFYALGIAFGFWHGSTTGNTTGAKSQRLDDLALLHKTVYQAVKAADATVTVLGPGWIAGGEARNPSLMSAYFGRSISTGGTPLDYTDVFAHHPYMVASDALNASAIYTICKGYNDAQLSVATKPVWGTESGHIGDQGALTVAQHALAIRRRGILCAALNTGALFYYGYEITQDGIGNPSQNAAPAQALNDIHTQVAGKTMTRCSILNDGTVWAAFSDGSTYRA